MLAATTCTPFENDLPTETVAQNLECDADVSNSSTEGGASCDPQAEFGTPVPVEGLAGVGNAIGGLRLSPDYLTGYFYAAGISNTSGVDDLYTATRCSLTGQCCSPTGSFGDVSPFIGGGINLADEDEWDPTVSGDGTTLVFARGMPAPGSPVHLYVATRQSSYPFGSAEILQGANGSNDTLDQTPFLLEDGGALYFSSDRNLDDLSDIFRAQWSGPGTAAPTPVTEVNTSFDEIAPVLSPDDRAIYFASDRTDGNAEGDFDIWVATRTSPDVAFSSPIDVPNVNSSALDVPTFITRDGCTLYLASQRSGTLMVYEATRGAP